MAGAVAVAVVLAVAISALGWRARSTEAAPPAAPSAGTVEPVDPASLPAVTIDPKVGGLSAALATPAGAQDLASALAWNLRVEAEAIATGDASLLPAITDGARLHDLEAVIEANGAGPRTVPEYTFESLDLVIVYPGGFQRGANAGLRARGTVTEVIRDASGAELGRTDRPLATTFSLRPTTAGRWLNTDTLPYQLGPDGRPD
jgi:hypothetical protein